MLTPIAPKEIPDNVFRLIGQDWMLITAGTPDNFNTMTASWGGMGVLWGRDVCWCVIRPQRYTREFIERSENFTLSFFTSEYRDALNLCGSRSGRDINKAKEAGLHPEPGAIAGTTQFAEARLVIACCKAYTHDIDPTRFLDPAIDSNYPKKDYHRLYVGFIESVGICR